MEPEEGAVVLTMESRVTLQGLTRREITDLLVDCDDVSYRKWWPGTHREFHVLNPAPGRHHVGDLVWMDEYVGSRHLRMAAEVLEVVPGERLVWQVRPWRLRLPVRLSLSLRDQGAGIVVRHTLTAGWTGWARVFDPLWRLYFSEAFARALRQHVATEFPLLERLLHPEDQPLTPSGHTSPLHSPEPLRGSSP